MNYAREIRRRARFMQNASTGSCADLAASAARGRTAPTLVPIKGAAIRRRFPADVYAITVWEVIRARGSKMAMSRRNFAGLICAAGQHC